MSIAGISFWVLVAIAGFVCLVILRMVGGMFKKNHPIGAAVILLGSLAMLGMMFTIFSGGNAKRISIDGVPLWQKDAPALPPPPPAIEQSEKHIEVHAIANDTGESTVSQVLHDAKVTVKQTLRNAKVSAKQALSNVSSEPLAQQIRTKPMSHLLTAVAIAAFLCVGYVFLDAGTRGHFTWRLRITALVAFAAIWVAMASLRGQL